MTKKDMELKCKYDKLWICLTPCPFGRSPKVGSYGCGECEQNRHYRGKLNKIYCQKQGELKEQLNKNGGLK